MADALAHLSPAHPVSEGRYGPEGLDGVLAAQVRGLAAAMLVARRGGAAALCRAMAGAGLPLCDAPRLSTGAGLSAIGTGPGRWLVLAEGVSGDELCARLAGIAQGHGAVTDQSDAVLLFDLSGETVHDALARGVTLDLHPRTFAVGDAATTLVAGISLTFWQSDAAPAYRFAVPRSFTPAFLRWLTASAAPFGFVLRGTERG